MTYGSVCSGIEAASVAWHGTPLNWTPRWFSEIAKFPSRVLMERWPDVPNLGDFTKIGKKHGPVDLVVGGTPCTDFSIAGKRAGMAGEDGSLAIEFIRLCKRIRSTWILFENVPGFLSSNKGQDFGTFLGALEDIGYFWSYRTLDAQYFGVPQQRRRVFVVGHRRAECARAVLFERSCLSWDPPPRRAEGKEIAGTLRGGASCGGWGGDPDRSGALVAVTAFHARQDPIHGAVSPALDADGSGSIAVTVALRGREGGWTAEVGGEVSTALRARRLTPREYERLQGFSGDHTAIPGASDSARYAAIGNSMAIPVMSWIGARIAMVEACT